MRIRRERIRVALAWFVLLMPAACGAQTIPDWSAVPYPPVPLAPATVIEPVLTADDVTDAPTLFVADPFLFHEGNGPWHMFFEALTTVPYRQQIAHATSADGIHWTYDRLVLDPGFNTSFPYVFKYEGEYYMAAVSPVANRSVHLYRAHNFPYDWTDDVTLLTGRDFADPAIVQYNGIWYMFCGQSGSGLCYLYWASRPTGGWVEHPLSPIVNDLSKARPAGRPFNFGGRLIRLAQKNDRVYGEAVRAFEVDTIGRTVYREHEIAESPILQASGVGWNRQGMHTCDAWWTGDRWIATVDGIDETWAIGIYRTATVAGTGGPVEPIRLWLGQNRPNPFSASTEILLQVIGAPAGAAAGSARRIGIYDGAGRQVRSLSAMDAGDAVQKIRWDGADAEGRPVAAGAYFYRLDSAERAAAGRMILIR